VGGVGAGVFVDVFCVLDVCGDAPPTVSDWSFGAVDGFGVMCVGVIVGAGFCGAGDGVDCAGKIVAGIFA